MKLVMAKEGYRKVKDKWLLARKCTSCGKWKAASADNFYRQKGCKYNLTADCKECRKKQRKQYYEANKEKETERNKQWREDNPEYAKQWYEKNKDKWLEYQKQWYQDNKEKILEQQKQYYEDNKEKVSEQHKQYREANKDKISEYYKRYYETNKKKELKRRKQYYEDNRNKIAEYQKQYYEANKDKIAKHQKRYYQSPKGQAAIFNGCQRRRIKEEEQGTGITKDQWLEMMSFFNWECAYSGERLTKDTRSVDHIVPLNSGGDNMIWNMVPMTRSLNSSKHANNMEKWYKEQDCYSEARLQKIYDWQEYAYNKWGKDTDYFNTNDIQIKLI